nr:MAG TPA: hypothetical protein [Caudoviricetes sp.]
MNTSLYSLISVHSILFIYCLISVKNRATQNTE